MFQKAFTGSAGDPGAQEDFEPIPSLPRSPTSRAPCLLLGDYGGEPGAGVGKLGGDHHVAHRVLAIGDVGAEPLEEVAGGAADLAGDEWDMEAVRDEGRQAVQGGGPRRFLRARRDA